MKDGDITSRRYDVLLLPADMKQEDVFSLTGRTPHRGSADNQLLKDASHRHRLVNMVTGCCLRSDVKRHTPSRLLGDHEG